MKKKSNLGKNSLIYILSYFVASLINFLLLPLYTDYLSPREFGIFSILLIIISILGSIMRFGQDAVLSRLYFEYYHDENKIGELMGSIIFSLLFFNIIIVFFLTLIGPYFFLSFFPSIEFYPLGIATIAIASLNVFVIMTFNYIRIIERAIQYATFQFLFLATNIIVSVYSLVYSNGGVWGLLKGALFANGIGFFCSILFFSINMRLRLKKDMILESFKLGVPFIPHGLANIGMRMSDSLFLGYLGGLANVGVYSIAIRLNTSLMVLLDSFNNAWNPIFQKVALEERENNNKYFSDIYNIYFILILLLMLIMNVFSNELISLMTSGDQYNAASKFMPILLVGVLFKGLYLMSSQQLIHKKQMKLMPVITISVAMLNLVFNYFFIRNFGTTGAAISNSLSNIVLGVMALFFAQKHYNIKINYIFIAKSFITYLILSFISNYIVFDSLFLVISLKMVVLLIFLIFCGGQKLYYQLLSINKYS